MNIPVELNLTIWFVVVYSLYACTVLLNYILSFSSSMIPESIEILEFIALSDGISHICLRLELPDTLLA